MGKASRQISVGRASARSHTVRQQHDRSSVEPQLMLVRKYVDDNRLAAMPGNMHHICLCQVWIRFSIWLWNQEEMSSEVQNRGIRGPTERHVSTEVFFEKYTGEQNCCKNEYNDQNWLIKNSSLFIIQDWVPRQSWTKMINIINGLSLNQLKQKRCNNVKACLVEQCINDIAVNIEMVSPCVDPTVSNHISESSPLILTRQ